MNQSAISPEWPGQVVNTLDLANDTLVPGNFLPVDILGPIWAAVDPARGRIYVTGVGPSSDYVTVIDRTTDTVVGTVPTGIGPHGIAVDDASGYLYVANLWSDNVTVIDLATDHAVGSIPIGPYPWDVAVDPANGYVYVTNGSTTNIAWPGTVTVINGTTNAKVGTITVGSGPSGIAVDSMNGYVYVADDVSSNLTVINGATNRVVGSIPVGSFPAVVAADNENGYVYVTNDGASNVTVVNATTNTVAGWITTGSLGDTPQDVAVDPANGYVYVTNPDGNNVTVIDGATNTMVGSIAAGLLPLGVAVDPVSGYVYVTNGLTDNVTVINGGTNRVLGSIQIGSSPYDIAADSGNGQIYAVNAYAETMMIVNDSTDKVLGSVPVDGWRGSVAIAVDSANGYLYLTDPLANSVTVINGSSNQVVGSVPVGYDPEAIAVDSANGYIYVANWGAGSPDWGNVTVINGATNTVVAWVPGCWGPARAVDSANGYVYVACWFSDNVSVIDGATNRVVGTITVGSGPSGIAVDHANGYVYVANGGSGNVTVIDGATHRVVETIPLGCGPVNVAADDANGYVYVTGCSKVTVIDGATDRVVGSVPVGIFPDGIAVDQAKGDIVVANECSGTLSFISLAYPVRFAEQGLPAGTNWSVTLNGTTLSSNATSVSFSEPKGSYSFSVGTVPGYAASITSGSVRTPGTTSTVVITFTQVTYSVTLTEHGLPAGTAWSATLTGNGQSYRQTTTGTSIVFVVPNGTYAAAVEIPEGYDASLSPGTITVAGQPAAASVTFTPKPFPWLLTGTLIVVILGGILAGLHFTRISRETIFQTGVRELIVNYVVSNPGVSFSAIRDTLGLQNGRAAYHLRVLEKQGFLHSETKRRRHLYFPNGNAALWQDLPVSPLQGSILKAIRDSPGVGVRDLGRRLGRNHTSVGYNVRTLSRDGLLRTEREGLRVRCYPVDDGGE